MATADGPIKKMFDFMRGKNSQAIIDTDLITESGHLTTGDEYSAPFSSVREQDNEYPNMRYGGEQNIPTEGDEVKISKRRAKDDAVRLKHKGYSNNADGHGVHSIYKAKKYKHSQKKKKDE